jgi:hypothetical protein
MCFERCVESVILVFGNGFVIFLTRGNYKFRDFSASMVPTDINESIYSM